jgi:ASCH domain
MKALSVVHPSGTKIARGEKTLEVRRWRPDLSPAEDLLIVENHRFLRNDGDRDDDGRAVAIVRVKAVRPFTPDDMKVACASYFEDGWLAWVLDDIRPVTSVGPVPAERGVYEVDFPSA